MAPIHVVYSCASLKQQAGKNHDHGRLGNYDFDDWIARSAEYMYRAASDATRSRLHLHFFHSTNMNMSEVDHWRISRRIKTDMHPTNFGEVKKDLIKVWGSYSYKLESPSNYMRFYIPEILRRKYGAERMLYVDTDTIFVGDVADIYDVRLPQGVPFAMGVQDSYCTAGTILNVQDKRLAHVGIDRHGECITASVALFDVQLWHSLRLLSEIEDWMRLNKMKAGMWKLGSMPPLMLVAHTRGWLRLPQVRDMKKVRDLQAYNFSGAVVLHPVKAWRCPESLGGLCDEVRRRL